MKYLPLAILMFLTSCNNERIHSEFDWYNNLLQDKAQSVVRLTYVNQFGRGFGGTGFVVQDSQGTKFIVTNTHVCKNLDFNAHFIYMNDSEKGATNNPQYYNDVDLCLLDYSGDLPSLELKQKRVPGMQVATIGYPRLLALSVNYGNIIGDTFHDMAQMVCRYEWFCFFSEHKFNTNIQLFEGSSGSPVFDRTGSVVGIIFAINNELDGWSMAIDSKHLIKILQR